MPSPYLTLDDLVSRFGSDVVLAIADHADTEDIASIEVFAAVDGAIDAAQGEVHGYVSRRYPVPIITVPLPLLIVGLMEDITMYKLCRGPLAEDDAYRIRYKDARKTLELIAKGTISLGAQDPDQGGGNYVSTTGTPTADRGRSRARLDKVF